MLEAGNGRGTGSSPGPVSNFVSRLSESLWPPITGRRGLQIICQNFQSKKESADSTPNALKQAPVKGSSWQPNTRVDNMMSPHAFSSNRHPSICCWINPAEMHKSCIDSGPQNTRDDSIATRRLSCRNGRVLHEHRSAKNTLHIPQHRRSGRSMRSKLMQKRTDSLHRFDVTDRSNI